MNQDTRLLVQDALAQIVGAFNRNVTVTPNSIRDCQIVVEQSDRIAAALSADRMEEVERMVEK